MISIPSESWLEQTGTLTSVSGRLCATLNASVNELAYITTDDSHEVLCEVIGFEKNAVQLMPFQSGVDFRAGNKVKATGKRMMAPVGECLLGRVLNANGEPIDGGPPLVGTEPIGLSISTPDPLNRTYISEPFVTGVRAIDGFLTMGKGQRVGVFAGSGVGKSTLLGEITKFASSEVNVVVLVGERGREVRPFVEQTLGKAGLARSIVIVSTSDQPPISRIRACELGVAISDWFRNRGKDVLFVLDSLSRLAYAQRELGLSLGEPPTSRGYTPSVFQKMAEVLEQLGTNDKGTITALITVLVDGDDMNDPVADSARSILDGHIVLNRELAHAGQFPAIDILQSTSRLLNEVNSPEAVAQIASVRSVLSSYKEVEDLLQIGAYQKGSSPKTDHAIQMYPRVVDFLKQGLNSPSDFGNTFRLLQSLTNEGVLR